MNTPRGQGLTEYIVIIALIAIAAIGVVTAFGDELRSLFGLSSDALAGETEVFRRDRTSFAERKTLNDFATQEEGGACGVMGCD